MKWNIICTTHSQVRDTDRECTGEEAQHDKSVLLRVTSERSAAEAEERLRGGMRAAAAVWGGSVAIGSDGWRRKRRWGGERGKGPEGD